MVSGHDEHFDILLNMTTLRCNVMHVRSTFYTHPIELQYCASNAINISYLNIHFVSDIKVKTHIRHITS